ncbi:MAG: MIP/aquaporin family protein [Bryobacteraceae bacterium]
MTRPADKVREGWPEYLMEAGCLGLFMLSACLFTVLFEHPAWALRQAIPNPVFRSTLIGAAMGLTLVLIVHSPWGKQSGAHMNPAVTLTYLSLGKIAPERAAFYVLAQFLGGMSGVGLAWLLTGESLAHPSVDFAITRPGPAGQTAAFLAETSISFVMMTAVLISANSRTWSRRTPYLAGALVALFITFESPLSGMSMNPARTFASAVAAGHWSGIWIYFSAPLLGMLLAAGFYKFAPGARRVYCAKLHHHNARRCLFNCHYGDLHAE